ncbi:MAG TPA: polysaccharide export protein EpsE [Burkholderiales bacterium]|jgi:polysaccharide export outer membrane protein
MSFFSRNKQGRMLSWWVFALAVLLTASAAFAAPVATAPLQSAASATQATPPQPAAAAAINQAPGHDSFVIGPGDTLKLTVFQYPDLTTETRVAANGSVSLPLAGEVAVSGMRPMDAERKVAEILRAGGFVKQAQVTLVVTQFRSQQVAVLGNVNRPGKYPLELPYTISDVLALAGGVAPTGADTVILSRTENGAVRTYEIDLPTLFMSPQDRSKDIPLINGDVLYVNRYPLFYIYGEVQRPGSYRVERNMTVMQALSTGGGLTLRGTERGVRVDRRSSDGKIETLRPKMSDAVQPDDVIYIRESLF